MELSGRYRLLGRLGEGGMGVVHEALDLKLERRVAIKTIRDTSRDPVARERFVREARAAAALSHPHACQVYEIDESDGRPFIVMELLDGETLASRLLRGPLSPTEAVAVMLPVLSALQALHARGLVHRDLKPSNVFLTLHGVKLLDFGLARPSSTDSTATQQNLTLPGTLTGTPRYMAPEQFMGEGVTPRTDVYAAGVLLYELLTGRTPFDASSTASLLLAILHQDPPRLGPDSGLAVFDPIVQRALDRDASRRYGSADEMASELTLDRTGVLAPLPAPPAIKLIVFPFRVLRPDDEVGFLEVALPDAITTSLSPVRSLIVRSPLAAVRFGASPDLPAVARELDVNHVLTGTLLRAGDQIRVTCQLVEAPGGRVRWSQTVQMPLGDLFQLQDDICRHIVAALPIDSPTPAPQDVPASAEAYELYLRASLLAQETSSWLTARNLFERCVAEDPRYAPAWARLGRIHRVIGKYVDDDYRASYDAAEEAFQRAFALNPDLSMAHHLYVYLEVEMGRADAALMRLLNRIARQPQQADLFAALCQAARYCGLLEVSVAAHERALRLDPQIRTSVAYTYLMMGDYRAILAGNRGEMEMVRAYASLELGGTLGEILQVIDGEMRRLPPRSPAALFSSALRAALVGDVDGAVRDCRRIFGTAYTFPDGEGIYTVVRVAAKVGAIALALDAFEHVVDRGYFCAPGFERDRWLDPLRGHAQFDLAMEKALARHLAAARAFEAAGGYQLLDISGNARRALP